MNSIRLKPTSAEIISGTAAITIWATGCIASVVGDEGQDPARVVESAGVHIEDIPSLFLSQLNDRLGLNKSKTTGK